MRYEAFVLLAEMRTGSNFLEDSLNLLPGLTCHGEAFNPHFVGYPNRDALMGVDLAARRADPMRLLRLIREADGLNGFRFFHDHEPRVLNAVLDDPAIAKVWLTRDPLQSFVSLKIARETDQWKLTNTKHRRTAKIRFDAAEYERHLARVEAHAAAVRARLQASGQAAFPVDFEEIGRPEVLNGIAAFLGLEGRLSKPSSKLRRQNPPDLRAKVENYDEMMHALGGAAGASQQASAEPSRAAAVTTWQVAETGLIHMPVRGGPEERVAAWLTALEGLHGREGPQTGLSQKEMRRWKRERPGHLSFAVVSHPLERAHRVFCRRILGSGPGTFAEIRTTLRREMDLDVPGDGIGGNWEPERHRRAFATWLEFLALNLSGQTAVRQDPSWATQSSLIQGFAGFAAPDRILREDGLGAALEDLAQEVGTEGPPLGPAPKTPVPLSEIADAALEARAAEIYQRDMVMLGFGDWRPAT